MKGRAAFLDRDGVLIKEKNYLHRIDDIDIYPETFNAIALLKEHNFKVIVVTNQGGIARGYYREDDVVKVHNEINRRLNEKGLNIDRFYYCPHYQGGEVKRYAIECKCRKPGPKMILDGAKEFNIDLKKSFVVGDKLSDIMAAVNAGTNAILVTTGYGSLYAEEVASMGFKVVNNIEDAVRLFIFGHL